MNHPLHIYLNDLVGNAKQLTITADNARIPMELSLDYGCREDASYYSGYSSHSSNPMDTSAESQGSASRWDSESCGSSSKERKPKKPLRRLNSSSPPPSPTEARSNVRRAVRQDTTDKDHRRKRIVECFGAMAEDDGENSMNLAKAAAKGMLRMPQRRASNDGSRKAAGRLPSKNRLLRPNLNINKVSARRNVGDILGEAIRELGMEDDIAAQ